MCSSLIATVLLALVGFNVAYVTRQPEANQQHASCLSEEAKSKILANCQRKSNRCQSQTAEYTKKRNQVKNTFVNQFKHQNVGAADEQAKQHAERRLNKIHQLKKTLHAKNSLHQIEPADNGLWLGDTLLSDQQIDYIAQILEHPKKFADSPAEYQRHPRAASLYFENVPYWRWTMPVHYWVSNDYTAAEKQTVDAALARISSATGGCIRFAKDSTQLVSGAQIQYLKIGDGCWGYADVGFQGINTVNLATSECTPEDLKGNTMHETIHGLGGQHEMSRTDRDWYIEVLYDNIDPQQWYAYDIDNTTTSYGVPYDYQSIMHYRQGGFQIAPGLDTMRPFVDTKLGSTDLSSNDILQLKRMYCSSCTDNYQECGNWAALRNFCNDATWGSFMQTYCRRSCGLC